MHIRQHPCGMPPNAHGFSHGLNKCPPDTCLHQCTHWCRPFESYLILCQKKRPHRMVWSFLLAEDEGFEPPQTESESGVLPLHKSSIAGTFIIIRTFLKMSRSFLKFSDKNNLPRKMFLIPPKERVFLPKHDPSDS